jgi:hypothetical protein
VLQTQRVIEELLKREVFELVLVFHLHLDDFGLVEVFVADEVFGQIDVSDTRIVLQELRQNEKVLAVQVLLPEVEFYQGVKFKGQQRQGPAMQRQGFHIVLVDKFP